jgi:hypothetical protein
MAAMPRKLPPFLHREITRHKLPVWYFRRGKGPRIRMPGEFNSVEFLAAYDAALKGARPARLGHAEGTFAWGLVAYRKSQAWTALSPATHAQRDGIFKGIEEGARRVEAHGMDTRRHSGGPRQTSLDSCRCGSVPEGDARVFRMGCRGWTREVESGRRR